MLEFFYHPLTQLAVVLEPAVGSFAPALVIVVCTLAVRLALLPLSRSAFRGAATRAEVLPRMRELTEKHRDNPERARKELARLQAESGSPLAGCLPQLAQLPFFWLLYQLFSTATIGAHPNLLLTGTLLGAPLGVHWPLFSSTPVFLALAAALIVVAYLSTRLQLLDDSTPPLARRIARILPYGTVATAAFVPLAVGLYLLTTTAWTVAERAILQR